VNCRSKSGTQFLSSLGLPRLCICFFLLLVVAACNKAQKTELSQEPLFGETVVVNDVQTQFTQTGSGFDGVWDISATSEQREISSRFGQFECPAFSQSYRVVVQNNTISNAAVGTVSLPQVSSDGTFTFETDALHTLDSFVKYKITGKFPGPSDSDPVGSGELNWSYAIYGTKGRSCASPITIRKSTIQPRIVDGDTLLFNKQQWQVEAQYKDKRLPGFHLIASPKYGKLSESDLKKGNLIYKPNEFSRLDFIAIRMWQTQEPFDTHHYFLVQSEASQLE